jgi:squalene-associated FAD-dependent desaturase
MQNETSPAAKTNRKTVCVIGGGIAGLSAAAFLVNNGLDVTLIESSPRLGGRAYSFFDKTLNGWVDNGQHIMASWYNNTFEFLKIIGTYEKLKFQNQLEVKFADLEGNRYHFKCPKLPPPLHLIWGIWKYRPLGFKDKLGIIRLVNSVMLEKYSEEELKTKDTAELFSLTKQSKKVSDYFWKPFIAAVFNAEPDETSAWQFVQIIKTGFLKKGGSNLVLPKSNLNELYVDKAEEYLNANGAKVLKPLRISTINISDGKIESIKTEEGKKLEFDYYISAVPFFEFRNIFTNEILNGEYDLIKNLSPSPILNIHFEFSTSGLMTDDFIGVINGTIQWVFRINERRICIVISSAKNLVDIDKDELIEICKSELFACMPGFKNAEIAYAKVVKEKRATFLPDIASVNSRPDCKTKFKNLFLAGDWVNTGYPATIESAVTSSKNCVNEILKLIS